jgi:hypothetical protein
MHLRPPFRRPQIFSFLATRRLTSLNPWVCRAACCLWSHDRPPLHLDDFDISEACRSLSRIDRHPPSCLALSPASHLNLRIPPPMCLHPLAPRLFIVYFGSSLSPRPRLHRSVHIRLRPTSPIRFPSWIHPMPPALRFRSSYHDFISFSHSFRRSSCSGSYVFHTSRLRLSLCFSLPGLEP